MSEIKVSDKKCEVCGKPATCYSTTVFASIVLYKCDAHKEYQSSFGGGRFYLTKP